MLNDLPYNYIALQEKVWLKIDDTKDYYKFFSRKYSIDIRRKFRFYDFVFIKYMIELIPFSLTSYINEMKFEI